MTGVKYKAGRGRGTAVFSKSVNWGMKSLPRRMGVVKVRKTKGMEVRCQRLIKTSDHGLQTRGIRRQLTGEGVKGTGRLRSGDYTRVRETTWEAGNREGTFHIRKPRIWVPGGKVARVAGTVTGAKKRQSSSEAIAGQQGEVSQGWAAGEHRKMTNQRLQSPGKVEIRA